MARGKNENLSKYTQVFDKKGKPPPGDPEREIPAAELSKRLSEEIKKREGLEDDLTKKDEKMRELEDRMNNMENLDLEEELRHKVEELNMIKNAYAKKMKNTIALQRIKYEKEIDKIRKDMKRIALTKGGAHFDEDLRRRERELDTREDELDLKEKELSGLRQEIEEMKTKLREVKALGSSGTSEIDSEELEKLHLDINKKTTAITKFEEMVNNREIEIDDLKKALNDEKERKENAKTELDNVRRGSVAMMKYITTLQSKKAEEDMAQMRVTLEAEIEKRQAMEDELQHREDELGKREAELLRRIEDISKGKAVDLDTVKSLEKELEKKSALIKKKEATLKKREKDIITKFKSLESEIRKKIKDGKIIQDIKREFASKEEDLKRVKELLQEKESELKRRETELNHRLSEMGADKALSEEVERLQEILAQKDVEIKGLKEGGAPSEDLNEEVTALQELVLVKEDEIGKKEKAIKVLRERINELAESGGTIDAGALEAAMAEKQEEIETMMEVVKQKDQQLAQAKNIKQGGGMKELFDEVKDLRSKIEAKDMELSKLRDAVTYKDDELNRRQIDINHKEKVLKEEYVKLDEAKKMGATVEEAQLKKRLEALEMKITQKEEELKQREKFIAIKMEDIKRREGELVEEDLAARASERDIEFKEEKIRTGNPRLDDLMYGGIPFGKQVLVMGPPFIGKETLVNGFLMEGILKGVPALILTTDTSPADLREEMKYLTPDIELYEKKGLLKYIDAYSKAMGMEEEDPHTIFVEHPTDYKGINKAIVTLAKEFTKISNYWRMAVRSISTLVTYSDPTTTFRFLQGMTGRAKREKIVAFYVLDKGMHNEQEIQTLGHLMDGAIEVKTDGVKTFLMVQGICDVQSRAWIQYQYSRRGLNIGSFSLDRIK